MIRRPKAANTGQIFVPVRQQDFAGFKLNESLAVGTPTVPPHSHEEPHITITLSGGCRETYMGKTQDLVSLTTTYFHPGESHKLDIISDLRGESFRTFDIQFAPDWLKRTLKNQISPRAVLSDGASPIQWLVLRLYKEFKETDEFSALAIEGLVLEILAGLGRESKRVGHRRRPPLWLSKVCQMIQDELTRRVTLSELAASAGVHPSHLVEVFRAHHHCTPGEFIRGLRVAASIQAMSDPSVSLADIASRAGFSDQSHFSRVFKRTTGMTPGEFRRISLDARK
jgi:AraC family transcriptional regulator